MASASTASHQSPGSSLSSHALHTIAATHSLADLLTRSFACLLAHQFGCLHFDLNGLLRIVEGIAYLRTKWNGMEMELTPRSAMSRRASQRGF